jgi:hypothetical protein
LLRCLFSDHTLEEIAMNLMTRLKPLAVCALLLAAAGAHAQFNTNLIVNPGAESDAGGDGNYVVNLSGWTVSGQMTAIAYSLGCPQGYPCLTDPGPAAPGLNHFSGGNVVLSTAAQTVDLSFAAAQVAGGGALYDLAGWLGGYASQSDNVTLTLTFRDGSGTALGVAAIGPVTAADRANATGLLLRQTSGSVPMGAATADLLLTATRVGGGTSNDGYADNLALSITAVPEPATVLLSLGGLAAIMLRRRQLLG